MPHVYSVRLVTTVHIHQPVVRTLLVLFDRSIYKHLKVTQLLISHKIRFRQSDDEFKVYDTEDSFFFLNRLISVISVVLRENTLTISDSTGETVSMESEIMTVLSLSTTEIPEITRLKIRSSRCGYLNALFSSSRNLGERDKMFLRMVGEYELWRPCVRATRVHQVFIE